jgi:hypothetical protein
MQLVGSGNQAKRHPLFTADGTIVAGGTPQLILPETPSRSFLKLQNLSVGPLWFEFGSARATAALTSGAISSITVTNAGFNFTKPPVVRFSGGGYSGNTSFLGLNQPGGDGPNSSIVSGRVAKAHCVMTGTAPNLSVSSIVIDDPGAGYAIAPYVFIMNSDLDPYGCAAPSATSGMLLTSNGPPYVLNGTSCFTDSVAVYGATTGQAFLARWMT